MSSELNQILNQSNQTEIDYSFHKCIHQLFEDRVKQVPNSVAVSFEDEQLTYWELNCKSNQLARYLQTQKVDLEVLVGLYIERSLETVVALLGVLKAGGAYVPLDPAYPKERIAYMMADAALEITLTQESLLSDLQQIIQVQESSTEITTVCLDKDWEIIAQKSTKNLSRKVKSSNLAYTIYTSGSTGKPKGVEITHLSVVNFLYSMAKEPGLNIQDVLLAVTTISFDIAGLEFYLPLSVGAQVVIASTKVASSPLLLQQLMRNSNITVMQATPATWYLLLAGGWTDQSNLKILSGGEALHSSLARQLLARGACVWNLYGPTETTIWSAVHRIKNFEQNSSQQNENSPVPIGRPIANTQLYVLDSSLQPVPSGKVGDLYIGGLGLARGYRNQPDLTQKRFISNPFGKGRLYQTGDLARYLDDGNLEFLGRSDHQIKICGFRIELGEIESILNQHPRVHQSLVDVQQFSSQFPEESKRLVAYIVPNSNSQKKQIAQGSEIQSDKIEQWRQLWDLAYMDEEPVFNPTFNINGWNDSYSGKPIPELDMREWLNGTVQRIFACRPSRVLEIGCGTGLILFRVAPKCSHYCGMDIAQNALQYIESQFEQLNGNWSHVELLQQAANNFEGLKSKTFDTVIINSVVQLFPNIDYLVEVIEKAVQVAGTGGTIFIGDIRSLNHLEAFHASIELHNAPDNLTREELMQRVQKSLGQEGQLAINPDFFSALQQHLPRISRVSIQLRRGHCHNEMTKFRYDAILYLDRENSSSIQPRCLNWQQDNLTVSKIRSYLSEQQPSHLGIKQIPNSRLLPEIKLLELL